MKDTNIFTVAPMGQILELNPGEIYSGSITVVNPVDATENFNYMASVMPYSVMTENYDVDVVTMTNRTRIAEWITIENPTGSLAQNETAEIKYTIAVPENAPAGGQYAAISVGTDNENQAQGNVSIVSRMEMASVIYAKVAGETVRKGEVLENNVPVFSAGVPVTVSSLINNDGNVHELAEITITVSDFFSGNTILPTDVDDGFYTDIIMPETTKYIAREINDLPLIGIVKVKQSIYYNYQISEVERDVFICPIWFIALVVVTIGAIIAGIVRTVKKHKKTKN